MAFTTSFDTERRLAALRAEGAVDFLSSVEALAGIAEDPRLRAGFRILIDVRHAEYHLTLADTRHLGDLRARARPLHRYPVAFVTGNPAHHAAATVVAGLLSAEGAIAKAFAEYDVALAWVLSAEAPRQ